MSQHNDPSTSTTSIGTVIDATPVDNVDTTPLPSDELRRVDRAFLALMRSRQCDVEDGPIQDAWADSRGLLSSTLETWGMGYCSPQILDIQLRTLEPADLVRAGLIYRRRLTPHEVRDEADHKHALDVDTKDRRRALPGYRATLGGRIAIPLRDQEGNIRSWIGRLVDDHKGLREVAGDYSPDEADPFSGEKAKYLNLGKSRSSRMVGGAQETDRFPLLLSPSFIERCSGLVENGHDTLSDKTTAIWVTEGYLDAALASQGGMSAIATGGCRTDEKQHLELVRLLGKFAAFGTPIYLCFDADPRRLEKNKNTELGAGQRGMCDLLGKIWEKDQSKGKRLARHIKIVLLKPPEFGGKVDLADELKKVYDSVPKPADGGDGPVGIIANLSARASWADRVLKAQKAKLEELAAGAVESIEYLTSQIPENVKPRDRTAALEECGLAAVAAHDPDLWVEVSDGVAGKLGVPTKDRKGWAKGVAKVAGEAAERAGKSNSEDRLARYTDKNGTIKPTYSAVYTLLEKKLSGRLAFNQMTLDPCEVGGLPWLVMPVDDGMMSDWQLLLGDLKCDAHREMVEQAVQALSLKTKINPVESWLRSRKHVEGKDLIPYVVSEVLGITEANEYTPEQITLYGIYIRKWLRSAVARALWPGCKVDLVLVFSGTTQGQYKSEFGRALVPVPAWFGVPNLSKLDREAVLAMRLHWICEEPEMEKGNHFKDIEAYKAFISLEADTVRPSYARRHGRFERLSVLFATTNKNQILVDPTGNRRYLPIPIRVPIRYELLEKIRDALWAQMTAEVLDWERRGRDKAECPWWLTSEERAQQEEDGQQFEADDPIREAIVEWLDLQPNRWVTSKALVEGAGIGTGKDGAAKQGDYMRAGPIMARLGWKKKVRDGRDRGYEAPPTWEPKKKAEGLHLVPHAPGAPTVMEVVTGILSDE